MVLLVFRSAHHMISPKKMVMMSSETVSWRKARSPTCEMTSSIVCTGSRSEAMANPECRYDGVKSMTCSRSEVRARAVTATSILLVLMLSSRSGRSMISYDHFHPSLLAAISQSSIDMPLSSWMIG